MFHFPDQFLQIIETNAFALEEPSYEMQMKLWIDNKEKCYPNPMNFGIKKRQIGTALYKNVSRFNHSCDPNVAFVFDKQFQRIILASTRYIEKGEELTISYGPVYHINKVNIYIHNIIIIDFIFMCILSILLNFSLFIYIYITKASGPWKISQAI